MCACVCPSVSVRVCACVIVCDLVVGNLDRRPRDGLGSVLILLRPGGCYVMLLEADAPVVLTVRSEVYTCCVVANVLCETRGGDDYWMISALKYC